MQYRTFFWQGHAISAFANATHTTLTRLNRTVPGYNRLYAFPPSSSSNTTNTTANGTTNLPIPVTVRPSSTTLNLTLTPLTIPNRQPHLNLTTPSNLIQCRPLVSTNTAYLPGRFPLAAIDGAVSTAWQPVSEGVDAWIIVDLGGEGMGGGQEGGQGRRVRGFVFDWGSAPARAYAVLFSNSSFPANFSYNLAATITTTTSTTPAPTTTTTLTSASNGPLIILAASGPIVPSNPCNATYAAETAAELTPYTSNTTEITLNSTVYAGRYAMLVVSGSWAGDGRGASVGEWGVVGDDGTGGVSKKVEMRRYYGG